MKISYSWLQTYFKKTLPSPEKLEELFTFHAFEVEGLEKLANGDTILDVKVLPDRAHYALSHQGVALEAALVTGLDRVLPAISVPADIQAKKGNALQATVTTALCRRFMGQKIEGIAISESPVWLKERLESVGQRSINMIVDVTNFVMLDLGQPLHAFDADKIAGDIVVRAAQADEKVVILNGAEIALDASMTVIADDHGALDVAGIKGGKRAEVTADTKNIILVSNNFDPISIRRTSVKIGIRNEASKRFENNLSPEWASIGLARAAALIAELSSGAIIGPAIDIYNSKPKQIQLEVTPAEINAILGIAVPEKEMTAILEKMEINVSQKKAANSPILDLEIPLYRQDLTMTEDIAEEIGRIYGYDKIAPLLPAVPSGAAPAVNRHYFYQEKIKDILVAQGFSEVLLYTFVPEGDVEVAYPLASDKKALRTNLADGMARALDLNSRNADLLGLDQIKLFEIGTTFKKGTEQIMLSLGARQVKKIKGMTDEALVKAVLVAAEQELGQPIDHKIIQAETGAVAEIDLNALIKKLPEPKSYAGIGQGELPDIKYRKFSVYPFISRDIAVFVPAEALEGDVAGLIKNEAGQLLIKTRLFDVFTKTQPDGSAKTSYAYRLVFQSPDRTLTDTEIQDVMQKITAALSSRGWQVR